MTDPVTEELVRRDSRGWPWRSSLVAALALHLAVVAAALLTPTRSRRPLVLPSVQVRLGVSLPAPPATSPGPAASRPAAALPRQAPAPARKPIEARTTERRAPGSDPARVPERAATVPAAAPEGDADGQRSPDGAVTRGAAGVSVGPPAAGNGEQDFPYAYYLQRLLGTVESNWFRPPAPAGTRCRVLCRVDRGGRLLEAGIEEPSGTPAFDRAALRAVYAAAPFPPLPQGFGGATLTLHLEFGP